MQEREFDRVIKGVILNAFDSERESPIHIFVEKC